jgi:hypothetical protein
MNEEEEYGADSDAWKTRKAPFSELKFLEPSTMAQNRFILGLRPISPEIPPSHSAPELWGMEGEEGMLPSLGQASGGKKGSASRGGKPMTDKQKIERLERENRMLLKELEDSNSRASTLEHQLDNEREKTEGLTVDLGEQGTDLESVKFERDKAIAGRKVLDKEFETLQEKFQAFMMKEMSKFPSREPSNLVFGRTKMTTRQRKEVKDAKSEMIWFEEKNQLKKKKKKKNESSREVGHHTKREMNKGRRAEA